MHIGSAINRRQPSIIQEDDEGGVAHRVRRDKRRMDLYMAVEKATAKCRRYNGLDEASCQFPTVAVGPSTPPSLSSLLAGTLEAAAVAVGTRPEADGFYLHEQKQ